MADPSVASSALGDWALIEMTGDDRLDWLQGQSTNDLRDFASGTSLSFCFCEPTGQLIAVLDAWAMEDRILMTTARECVAPVLERVERMTILEDVAARELSGEYAKFTFQGNDAGQAVARVFDLPEGDAGVAHGSPIEPPALLLRSVRTLGGWDVWIPKGTRVARQSLAIEARSLSFDEEEALRIAAGIPKWGRDMGPRTLPPELGPAFEARHVSYTKGCYTGQEVLMRMHTRGHTNRTWVGLAASETMEVGEAVICEGKEVGRVSSASPHVFERAGFTHVAAATLRNEAIAEGAVVSVGEGRAEVRQMPILPRA